MFRNLLAITVSLAMLATAFAAGAACTAGNPSASVIESTPTSAFTDHGNGTVTHSLTGLMWKQCAQGLSGAGCATGSSGTQMTWRDALKAAGADTTAGYSDWRLPNKKELGSIVEYCGYSPAINQTLFPNFQGTPQLIFWSGSQYPTSFVSAWAVAFGDGDTGLVGKSNIQYVRLVRGGQSFDSFDAQRPPACSADIDGNGSFDALTDGLLFIRALFGLTGTAVTNGALGVGATRNDWAAIRTFMNGRCGTNLAP